MEFLNLSLASRVTTDNRKCLRLNLSSFNLLLIQITMQNATKFGATIFYFYYEFCIYS